MSLMPMRLMYITNDVPTALCAESAGVDWVFVDLELLGKVERQGHLDSVISHHTIDDVARISAALRVARVLVRVNPIHENSAREIDQVIDAGANIVMLPYFHGPREVEYFLSCVSGRAETCLLVETPSAVHCLAEIVTLPGIDHVHIGLNDLHLAYGMKFMFESLACGLVEDIVETVRPVIPSYGFGGVGRIGTGQLSAELIVSEHVRLGSSMVILSRGFLGSMQGETDLGRLSDQFMSGVAQLRACHRLLVEHSSASDLEANRRRVVADVRQICAEVVR